MERAINVIILALAYVAIVVITEFLGMLFHPYVWTYCAVPIAALAAWPYAKLCERHPMPGIAILCALLLLFTNFLCGQGHEYFALGCVVFGCLAEVLRKIVGGYTSRKSVIASYAMMSLIPFSMTCVWWVDFDAAINMKIINIENIYFATTANMLNLGTLAVMIVATLIVAVTTMWFVTKRWYPRDPHHVVF